MKDKILQVVGSAYISHNFVTTDKKEFLIVDWTNYYKKVYKKGEIKLHEQLPVTDPEGKGMSGVHFSNENNVKITADLFGDNALKDGKKHSSQCETIMYPDSYKEDYWILLIETKYCEKLQTAINLYYKEPYPNKMISQIIDTASYFRNKGVINKNKLIHGLGSFPNLLENIFGGFLRTNLSDDMLKMKKENNILFNFANRVKVNSEVDIII